jgi:OmpA-OmpF porin, OOP family
MSRIVLAAILIALAPGSALAQMGDNDTGFYVGGGVGQFNVQIDDVDQTDEAIERLDDDDTAWKAFVGWRFMPFLSLELAYVDFGGPSDRIEAAGASGDYQVELSGFAPYVIGTVPLGMVELFGKIGYYFYDVDLTADLDDPLAPDIDSSSSEEDLVYGAGVGMTFFERLHARLEYEKIDSDTVDDADALWLSGAWRF